MKKTTLLFMAASLLMIISGCGEGSNQDPGNMEIPSDVDFGENDYETIVPSNNQLGFNVLDKIDSNKEGNTFISPTSLYMALSMVYNGADDKTKEDMAQVLHAEGMSAKELDQASASLISQLHHQSDKTDLQMANSIWLNDQYELQDHFVTANNDYFNAKVEEIDVSDDASAEKINDWVGESTDDHIDEMVEAPLDENLVALLVNALYFQGSWTFPFDEGATKQESFHLDDDTTKDVSMMTLNGDLPYMENEAFQAVSLPYGDSQKVERTMNIFLPKEDSKLSEFKQQLNEDNWNKWNDEFSKTNGTLQLPKFQTEYEVELNDTLKSLGMSSAFGDEADFSKMVEGNHPLFISEVKQKAFLDVDEEGTEAAASTSVAVSESAASVETFDMKVDRPFFMTINDSETGTILFMGSISNPQDS